MNELNENHQICYFDLRNARGQAASLLTFGFHLFADTFLYKNQDKLKELCSKISSPPELEEISGFITNQLIDSIKIHICFENFLKGVFLANGVLIHKLDKDIFPELFKKQKQEPVHRDEVVSLSKWEENLKINLPNTNLRKQIKGITRWTLGINILSENGYLEKINFSNDILDILNPYLEYRNNLHYYTGESFTLSKMDYINFRKLVDFANLNIVGIQHKLVDMLDKGDNYKLIKI